VGIFPAVDASSSAGVFPAADVSFAGASSVFSSSTRGVGDEAHRESGAVAAVPAPTAPAEDATGAAANAAGVVFPAALALRLASFVEGGSMDIVSFVGLGALHVFFFFFFLGRLCGGARIRWCRGRK
jgi:hypothetical protein